jgi:hypothetical protein
MVAQQKQCSNAGLRQAHDPFAPFTLVGGRRRAIFVGIPGKQHQVNFFRDGSVNNCVEGMQKIQNAQRQTADGIMPSVIGHVDMRVGEMQDFDHALNLGMSRLARMLIPVCKAFSKTISFIRTGALIFRARNAVISSGMRGLGKASEV